MSIIRITKEFNFEMAHALYGYNGACKNIHGHSYKLSVCIIGKIKNQRNNPKDGMVVDFLNIKAIVMSEIIDEFDHALVLNANSPHKDFATGNELFEKIILFNKQPTCENLIIDFAGKLKKRLPKNMTLHHLCLRETASSFAEWFASDN